uniref:Uncharacterized protein n=1 Tax=Anguilla anguilla TaxID=7936 RepID=A0A0E9UHV2_ANGAN
MKRGALDLGQFLLAFALAITLIQIDLGIICPQEV